MAPLPNATHVRMTQSGWPGLAAPPLPASVNRAVPYMRVPYTQVCFEMEQYSDLTYMTYDGTGNLWAALYDESEACCPVGGREGRAGGVLPGGWAGPREGWAGGRGGRGPGGKGRERGGANTEGPTGALALH